MTVSPAAGRRYLYLSHAADGFADEDLQQLVTECRAHNAEHGISGILVYLDGRFGQAIEGPAPAMDALVDRLWRDPRHHDIVVLLDGPVQEPIFGGWSLASQSGPTAAAAGEFAALVAERLRRSADPDAAAVKALLGRFWGEFAR